MVLLGCSGEAPTVPGSEVTQPNPAVASGTDFPQVQAIYPADDTGIIPVDTDVVLVFSRSIDDTTLSGNITVTGTGVPGYSFTASTDKRVVRIEFASDLTESQVYTVNVTTGVLDTEGNALDAATSEDFTTAADVSANYDPQVLGVNPANGSTVSVETGYVEVYFSKAIDAATVTAASFSITGGVESGVPAQIDTTTFRLDLNTLTYGDTYTVTLTSAITDTDTIANALTGTPYTWNFTAETDPVPSGNVLITSMWVTDVTTSGATINWITDDQTEDVDTTINYGTGTTYGTSVTEGSLNTYTTVHSRAITGLNAASKYYFQVAWDDSVNTPDSVTGSFVTLENSGTSLDDEVDTGAAMSTMTTLQEENISGYTGKGYLFWGRGGATVNGQHYDTSANVEWGAGGSQIHGSAAVTVRAFSDGLGGALVTLDDGSGFYVKHLYDNTGALAFHTGNADVSGWDTVNTAGNNGLAFGHAAADYTNVRGGLVYNGVSNNITAETVTKILPAPATTAPLVTEMNGYPSSQIIFDYSQNFTTIGNLDDGDLVLVTDGSYNVTGADFPGETESVSVTGYSDDFSWYIYEASDFVSDSDLYVLVDADNTVASTGDGYTVSSPAYDTSGTSLYTTTDISAFVVGDIIVNTDTNEYGYITATSVPVAGVWQVTIDNDTSLANDSNFTAYKRLAGRLGLTGTALTAKIVTDSATYYPLWDDDTDFSSLSGGEFALNETDFTLTTVSSVLANNQSLQIAADIMADNESFWIADITGAPGNIVAFGKRDSGDAVNVIDDDTGTEYGSFAAAVVGDVVYNVTDDRYAAVISDDTGSGMTLSRDIVDNTTDTDTYIIFSSDEPLLDLGLCSANGTNQVIDTTDADFVNGGIQAGDILYYYNGGSYDVRTIIAVTATTLSLSGTLNTVSGNHYYIVQPKVLFAWEDTDAGFVRIVGQYIRLRDGSSDGTVFQIADSAAYSFTEPFVISSGAGDVYVIYQNGNDTSIRGKRLDSEGTFLTGTDGTTDGDSLGSGTIIDVLADRNGGFYLLWDNGANLSLRRFNDTGTPDWGAVTFSTTGNDAAIALDDSGNPLIAFSDDNGDLYLRKYSAAAGAIVGGFNDTVTSLDSYVSGVSIVSTENGGAILSWLDNRYYTITGYQVLAQAFDGAGAPRWDADGASSGDYEGVTMGIPDTFIPGDVVIQSLFYGGASPYNGLFFWYDYRDAGNHIFSDTKSY